MRFLNRPRGHDIFQPRVLHEIMDEIERLDKLTGDGNVMIADGPEGKVASLSAAIAAAAVATPPQLFIHPLAPQSGTPPQYPWIIQNWTGSAWTSGPQSGTYVAGPTVAPNVTTSGSGGTIAANTYYIVDSYVMTNGTETNYSPEKVVTTTGAASTLTITPPAPATSYASINIYVGTTTGGPYYYQANTPLGTPITLTHLTLSGLVATNLHLPAFELNGVYTNPGTIIVPAWYTGPSFQPRFQLDYCSTAVGF